MDISAIKGNDSAVNEGRWFPMDETTKVRICSRHKDAFKKAMRRAARKNRSKSRSAEATDILGDKLSCKAMAEHIVVGWEGVTEGGKKVPYSIETAERYLNEVPVFFEFVESCASDMEAFADGAESEEIDNAKKS
jgi:hypothetical protein